MLDGLPSPVAAPARLRSRSNPSCLLNLACVTVLLFSNASHRAVCPHAPSPFNGLSLTGDDPCLLQQTSRMKDSTCQLAKQWCQLRSPKSKARGRRIRNIKGQQIALQSCPAHSWSSVWCLCWFGWSVWLACLVSSCLALRRPQRPNFQMCAAGPLADKLPGCSAAHGGTSDDPGAAGGGGRLKGQLIIHAVLGPASAEGRASFSQSGSGEQVKQSWPRATLLRVHVNRPASFQPRALRRKAVQPQANKPSQLQPPQASLPT